MHYKISSCIYSSINCNLYTTLYSAIVYSLPAIVYLLCDMVYIYHTVSQLWCVTSETKCIRSFSSCSSVSGLQCYSVGVNKKR